jgi:hypothetical protein
MKMNFRKVDDCPLDSIKPYQRRKLSHRRLAAGIATAAATAVGSGERLCEKADMM